MFHSFIKTDIFHKSIVNIFVCCIIFSFILVFLLLNCLVYNNDSILYLNSVLFVVFISQKIHFLKPLKYKYFTITG